MLVSISIGRVDSDPSNRAGSILLHNHHGELLALTNSDHCRPLESPDPSPRVNNQCPRLSCWPVPEVTCGSYVYDDGASLCPDGFVPVADGDVVSCGVGQDCDDETCCEEGERCFACFFWNHPLVAVAKA